MKKNNTHKGNEGKICELVLHQRLINRKNIFYHKANNHCFQISMYYPNVLAKNLKG